MKRIRYWLTSKRLLMAQLHDMQRQLQEAWERCDELITDRALMAQDVDYTRIQLRRLSRERFQERELRLVAEECIVAWEDAYNERDKALAEERELRLAAEELRDVYLAQLENEEE